MNILGVPKAIYKAQQAKKQMSKLQAAGQHEGVSLLLNGLNEITEAEIEIDTIRGIVGDQISDADMEKLARKLSESIKRAYADAKKQIEKQLVSSTNLDDLKDMLSGM